MEGQDGKPQMSRHSSAGSHLGSTMKLFASLGLSPSDLDALVEIPEEDISVETLPQILMQLKSRKTEVAERRSMTTASSDAAFRGGGWNDVPTGRMASSSLGPGSARAQASVDFGFSSLQDMAQNQGFNLNYASGGGGGGSRERSYSELRRMGSPSNGKVQDFLGVTPTMFPHVCSLCDFDVHSILLSPQPRSRVVVVKYDRKPLSNKTLFAFTEPFGVLREHLVLKNKAFLEMSSHEEAVDMVNYHKENPAFLYGKPISFYLSKTLLVIEVRPERAHEHVQERHSREDSIQHSQVVFFSNLPREEEKKRELLTIAGRFGIVEKHLFLTDQAFIQLGTPQDAKMMVKYYTMNPLTIRGRKIRLNICAKYKTLDTSRRLDRSDRSHGPGGSSTRTSAGTLRTSSCSSKMKEKKKEDEEIGMESPRSEEKLVGKLVTNGDVEGEEPEKAETTDESEEVEQEVPGDEKVAGDDGGGVASASAVDPETPPGEPDGGEQRGEADKAPPEAAEAEDALGDVENMEDFVTLDELAEDEDECAAYTSSCPQGMRVVNIVGFRRGYNFLNELLALAKPFGKVVKHLVLDLRAEAYLQFETEEQAKTMARFYNTNVTASVCGRPVRISHSTSYPTIQCGSSKVVYVGNIPSSSFSDESILKLAEPFGKVCKYFTNRIKREAFIEMENAEDAEKMGEYCKEKSLKFSGNRLMVYVSRKYRQLKHGSVSASVTSSSQPNQEGQQWSLSRVLQTSWRTSSQEAQNKRRKKGARSSQMFVATPATRSQKGQAESLQPQMDKVGVASLPLPPYDPSVPIGVEHVRLGYYCRVCLLFYSNEDMAKKTHCSSQAHYQKLQVK
uniref:Matrin 3-like 1.1 n=1 Tax=Tetraodon nigroviridis TaxID=99883 RepID=H3CBX0_TETNG